MTVQEAKELCISDVLFVSDEHEEFVFKALEEVEQYRFLGTVEEIKKKIQTELPYMSLAQARFKSELDEYRNLGTVEELKEAREKQIPQKPTDIDEDANTFVCPSCGHTLIALDDMTVHQHCLICGKALKWGEEDEA